MLGDIQNRVPSVSVMRAPSRGDSGPEGAGTTGRTAVPTLRGRLLRTDTGGAGSRDATGRLQERGPACGPPGHGTRVSVRGGRVSGLRGSSANTAFPAIRSFMSTRCSNKSLFSETRFCVFGENMVEE